MKNTKNIFKNILLFLFLIIITFIFIFKNEDISKTFNILFSVDFKYIILAVIAMGIYFVCEGANVKSVLNVLGEKISFLKAIKYSLIGYFFSGITPAASGGQPMEIYIMHKDNIPIYKSTVSLLVELITFQMITIIFGFIGVIINFRFLDNGFIFLFIVGITLNIIALTAMLLCLFSSKLAKKIVDIFIKILKFFKYSKCEELRNKINNSINQYNQSASIIKEHKEIMAKSILIVLIQVLSYLTIPYFIYKSFHLNHYTILRLMTIQSMLYSSVSSMPLPGAVGISETAFLNVYKKIYSPTYVSSAVILNRFVNFYLYVIVGMIITGITIIKMRKKTKN